MKRVRFYVCVCLYGGLGLATVTSTATSTTPSAPRSGKAAAPASPAAHSPAAAAGRSTLEPALRDPFMPVAAPAPTALRVPPLVQVQKPLESSVPASAAPPAPPPLDLRYAGQMTAPDGTQVVYATHGQNTLVLATGLELPNGYRVEKVSPRAVELIFPALNASARLDIPSPPPFELR